MYGIEEFVNVHASSVLKVPGVVEESYLKKSMMAD